MDDDAETYKLWRIRKTVMQVRDLGYVFHRILLIYSLYNRNSTRYEEYYQKCVYNLHNLRNIYTFSLFFIAILVNKNLTSKVNKV